MSVKINSLEFDDIKRIKAVRLTPSENGLTIIGGKNSQGKTSVLDAIAWALGGDRFRPSAPTREGSIVPPKLSVKLSNGIVVERSGKNSDLKVIDPDGKRGGQQLLNAFVSTFALDLPKFMESSSKEKAAVLLKIIGVGDRLNELDNSESRLYNRRLEIGRIADQKGKFAAEMPYFPNMPEDIISASELIMKQQEILARNGENQRKRQQLLHYRAEYDRLKAESEAIAKKLAEAAENVTIAEKSAENLVDESTAELEESIRQIDETNIKIRSNLDKWKAEEDAKAYKEQYDNLTAEIEKIRADRVGLLANADLPLAGLSVKDGELTYNGAKWDCMSASEQLRVATAIVRKLNPQCGFVLLDKLEQMDADTLNEFGEWLSAEGLQAIATRVSTGGECSIIIEDGYVKDADNTSVQTSKTWKAGEF